MSIGYSEEKAARFIRARLPEDSRKEYTDDDLLCVVDVIWDYYETQGLLSLNDLDAEDELLNEDELIAYVKREIKADGSVAVDAADIPTIVKAELEYEESLEDII